LAISHSNFALSKILALNLKRSSVRISLATISDTTP
jgi:hypothetical protein